MDIQPIPTKYKGIEFRSRLEARWAVFFDTLEIRWEYEPECFDLGNGIYYTPDFKVYPNEKGLFEFSGWNYGKDTFYAEVKKHVEFDLNISFNDLKIKGYDLLTWFDEKQRNIEHIVSNDSATCIKSRVRCSDGGHFLGRERVRVIVHQSRDCREVVTDVLNATR